MNKLPLIEILTILQKEKITVKELVGRHNPLTFVKMVGKIQAIAVPTFEDYEEQERTDEGFFITHFVDHNVYLKTIAQVDSYSTNETYPYGYGIEVFPKEKMVTVYE